MYMCVCVRVCVCLYIFKHKVVEIYKYAVVLLLYVCESCTKPNHFHPQIIISGILGIVTWVKKNKIAVSTVMQMYARKNLL